MPWTGLGFLIISPLFTPLFFRKLGQLYSAISELRVREASLLTLPGGDGGCSIRLEPTDGIGILFSGWRQQSKKVRNWAVRSVSSEPPAEGDGESAGALAGGPLKIGLAFPHLLGLQTAVREYEHSLYIWKKKNRP